MKYLLRRKWSWIATLLMLSLYAAARIPQHEPDTLRKDSAFQPGDSITKVVALNSSAQADSIITFAQQYLGKRYKIAGTGKGGFDCSGFVCHVMQHYGYRLPHSSAEQYLLGISVSKEHARKGDLIFFRGRNYRTKRVGHVGIVMSNKSGVITFIHSSVQGGVMVNKNTDLYYNKRFVGTRRILKP